MSVLGKILRPFFGVTEKEATAFSEGDRQAAQRLETVIRLVTKGCHMTLQNSRFEVLVPKLEAVETELRGFAYEGAGIGLVALDCLFPWKNRTWDFLKGPGSAYVYAVPLGGGMALARLHRNPERFLPRLDPLYGWLIIDGYGFHQGFFARKRFVERQEVPVRISPFALTIFDNGLGRSIWFSSGTDVERVAATISAFPPSRQPALWSGVGLACGYTGGAARSTVESLREAAGPYKTQLAVGAALATNARHGVGNLSPHAELASDVLCGMPSKEASQIVDDARLSLPAKSEEPIYKIWRQHIAAHFAVSEEQETHIAQ
jgi:hypothetical protein